MDTEHQPHQGHLPSHPPPLVSLIPSSQGPWVVTFSLQVCCLLQHNGWMGAPWDVQGSVVLFYSSTLVCSSAQPYLWPVCGAPWSSWCHILGSIPSVLALRGVDSGDYPNAHILLWLLKGMIAAKWLNTFYFYFILIIKKWFFLH